MALCTSSSFLVGVQTALTSSPYRDNAHLISLARFVLRAAEGGISYAWRASPAKPFSAADGPSPTTWPDEPFPATAPPQANRCQVLETGIAWTTTRPGLLHERPLKMKRAWSNASEWPLWRDGVARDTRRRDWLRQILNAPQPLSHFADSGRIMAVSIHLPLSSYHHA
ncbi:uncharacterized protein TrAFT101_003999 [Trichoderma asperellum]|uniref:uncharacterized protein n=1 Tax=Trichoderma asperellum TaxID=101201 RepID=UPI00332AA0C4|nr:hypothetical protein TrAFT101_003999 [Trichoderma asperellum]